MNKFGIRMKERPVGEIFKWNKMKLEIVPTAITSIPVKCTQCIFYKKCCVRIPCFPIERNDGKNIYYKKIESYGKNYY